MDAEAMQQAKQLAMRTGVPIYVRSGGMCVQPWLCVTHAYEKWRVRISANFGRDCGIAAVATALQREPRRSTHGYWCAGADCLMT